MSHKFENQDIRQEKTVHEMQQMLTSVARRTAEHTFKTKQLLKEQAEEPTQTVQQALTSLQKQPNEAIT